VREVAAIILAAGRSERMGVFKPLLPFGPTTVIQSCINYLREASVESIVVVAGHKAEELANSLVNEPVKIVVNPLPHSQMNSSIAYGTRSVPLDAQALLIALADHPAISSPVIEELISNWKAGALIAKPTWQGKGGHPVLVDLQFRAELTNLEPDAGLKGFFQKHHELVRRVPVASPYVARDMDTWDDYLSLHTEVFGKRPAAAKG
jgi:molybdenum cofactor cytidylyltransferase